MSSKKYESIEHSDEDDLDPRIQVELERLNNATDEINKLEMELDEANGTFRMLMTDSTRRITLWAHKLGSCVEKARPYYEALEIAKKAQLDCQRAAVKFQRSSEIHKAAKEMVTVAETRYLSKQDEWKFDTAWQEMLNHATKKVTEAEHTKAESGKEHQKRATLYNAAEQKVQVLEQKLRRHILKSRPYFDEKAVCEGSLVAQKQRMAELHAAIAKAKAQYATSLRNLEAISEDIHQRRKERKSPKGPREPGVGAELVPSPPIEIPPIKTATPSIQPTTPPASSGNVGEFRCVVDVDDTLSLGSVSRATSSVISDSENDDEDLDTLRAQVKELSQMSSEEQTDEWESELSSTIHRLDKALLLRECEEALKSSSPSTSQADPSCSADQTIHHC